MARRTSCFLFQAEALQYGVLESEVVRIVARDDWRGAPPLDVRELGIDVPPEWTPERVLLLEAGPEVLPLVVRGTVLRRELAEEDILELAARPWAMGPFSALLLEEGVPRALLLRRSALVDLWRQLRVDVADSEGASAPRLGRLQDEEAHESVRPDFSRARPALRAAGDDVVSSAPRRGAPR